MSKYRALFIEESREHLAELSRLLVALETSQAPVPVVDEIFRHAHSIKGMAASMGYDACVSLAHGLEDVVAVYRESGRSPAPEVIDLLLRGVDAVAGQVEAVAEEEPIPPCAELVAELGAVMTASSASRAAKPRAFESPHVPVADAPARVVEVVLDPECKTPAARLFMVHRKLSARGTILRSTPTLEEIRAGQASRSLQLTFTSDEEDGAVEKLLASVQDVQSVSLGCKAPAVAPAAAPATAAGPRGAGESMEPAKAAATVRVRTDILDNLIDNVGELFILRARFESLLAGVADPELRASLDALSARIRDVHSQVMSVRMTPMHTLTDRYPRLARDLARSLGKEVELAVEGGEIELDRAILEALDSPFVHTLRNAIDHGIESLEERAAGGKPAAGKITISAVRDRDSVLVIIEDDGRGLDVQQLVQRAVRLGLLSDKQAAAVSGREAFFLICEPGFSTKAEVSDVSGRGVGMDVVRAKIEGLGGTLDIESETGTGTRFIFRLPLTVAIINVLLVEAGRRVFALPVAKVVAVRETAEDTIQEASGAVYLSFRHALAPVLDLAHLLGLDSRKRAEYAVVLEDGRDLIAVGVDRVVGYHEVVVKPLGDPLDRMDWFSGATILGDGRPILILDLPKALRSRLAA